MKSKIDKHNKSILKPIIEDPSERTCDCRPKDKPNCPLQGNCLVSSVVYKAEVTTPGTTKKTYYGLTERSFKKRFNEHNSSFRLQSKRNATELSKYVWDLKNKNLQPKVSWSIRAKAFTYKGGSTHCDLCLTEKTIIALSDPASTLNSRTEILGKCRHRFKFTLKNV